MQSKMPRWSFRLFLLKLGENFENGGGFKGSKGVEEGSKFPSVTVYCFKIFKEEFNFS